MFVGLKEDHCRLPAGPDKGKVVVQVHLGPHPPKMPLTSLNAFTEPFCLIRQSRQNRLRDSFETHSCPG